MCYRNISYTIKSYLGYGYLCTPAGITDPADRFIIQIRRCQILVFRSSTFLASSSFFSSGSWSKKIPLGHSDDSRGSVSRRLTEILRLYLSIGYERIWISSGDLMHHHPSVFTYDYAIRYHAREQTPLDIYTHTYVIFDGYVMTQPSTRWFRDKTSSSGKTRIKKKRERNIEILRYRYCVLKANKREKMGNNVDQIWYVTYNMCETRGITSCKIHYLVNINYVLITAHKYGICVFISLSFILFPKSTIILTVLHSINSYIFTDSGCCKQKTRKLTPL